MENKMKKDLGVLEAVFPMPVLMIATYNEDGTLQEYGRISLLCT